MSDTWFRQLVREMRAAQKAFFKARVDPQRDPDEVRELLRLSKSLEKRVDDELSGNTTIAMEMAE